MEKKLILLALSFLFINFVYGYGIDNPTIPHMNSEISSITTSTNYSLVNVNNSDFLDGYDWTTYPLNIYWYNQSLPFYNWLSNSGVIRVINATGGMISYYPDNTDASRGSYLYLAVSTNGKYGDTIYLSANTFDLGVASMTIPSGVSIIGSGRKNTIILSQANLITGVKDPCIVAGTNTSVSDLTIRANGGNIYQAPYGFSSPAIMPVNAIITRVDIYGNTDGLYFNTDSAINNNFASVKVDDVYIETKWDAITNTGDVEDLIEVSNFVINVTGPSSVGGYSGSRGIINGGKSTMIIRDGSIKVSGGTPYNVGLFSNNGDPEEYTSNTITEVYNVDIQTSGTGAEDIRLNNRTMRIGGDFYNTSKVNISNGGVIVYADTLAILSSISEYVVLNNTNGGYVLNVSSISMGLYTLNATEWSFLDGQNQCVNMTCAPTFDTTTALKPKAASGTAYLQFLRSTGARRGYVGVASGDSTQIDLKSDSGSLNLASSTTTVNIGTIGAVVQTYAGGTEYRLQNTLGTYQTPASFFSFYNKTTRGGFFGFESTSNNNFAFQNEIGDLRFGSNNNLASDSVLAVPLYGFKVNTTGTTFNKDVNVIGNFTGNQIYIFVYNYTETGFTVTPSASGVFQNFTGFYNNEDNPYGNGIKLWNDTSSNGGDKLQVLFDGMYSIDFDSTTDAVSGGIYTFGIANNSAGLTKGRCFTEYEGDGRIQSNAIQCMKRLRAGDNLSLMFKDDANPVKAVDIYRVSIRVVRVAD